jgi:hypothetical protein
MVRLWENTAGDPSTISSAFSASAVAMGKLIRAWAINADIALADDTATALNDSKFGTGLRPPEFFLTLIAMEYTFGDRQRLFSGRNAKRGATQDIRAMMERVTLYLPSIPSDQLVQQYASGSGHNFGAKGTSSWARNFYLDVSDFWRALDEWSGVFMLFFRPPPAPPT